jgi:tetratricopeptide (TPR) repeat protein
MEKLMKRCQRLTGCVVALALVPTAAGRAQSLEVTPRPRTATTRPAPRGTTEVVNAIFAQLGDQDVSVQAQGIEQIRAMLRSNPQRAVIGLRGGWIKRLMELQRYDDVVAIGLAGILAYPPEAASVEQIQKFRVQALLAEGKPSEALAASKQLFAIATLKGTADAVRTVCQCLDALHPDDRELLRRYREEQIEGAASRQSPTSNPVLILNDVQIDPEPYRAAINSPTAEDYKSLTGQGNLMLMAGEFDEAREVFDRAYTLAGDKDLPAATENLARCMKARDGTIGRANAWVLSIRPQATADRPPLSAFTASPASHKE